MSTHMIESQYDELSVFNQDLLESSYRVFKALITNPDKPTSSLEVSGRFLFHKDLLQTYRKQDILEFANKEFLSAQQVTKTFHKTWKKVKDSPIEKLMCEQLIHYFSTYGLEALGIKIEGVTYIPPNEDFQFPDEVGVVFIPSIGFEEARKRLYQILISSMAMDSQFVSDVMLLLKQLGSKDYLQRLIDEKRIKNKELRVTICNSLDVLPSDGEELLRYIVYKHTGKTLLIKNKELISACKQASSVWSRLTPADLSSLSTVFYRFKPLFLAFRKSGVIARKSVNKIRKLAYRNHKPMTPDYLGTITSRLYGNKPVDRLILDRHLRHANVYRKIRLMQAIYFYSSYSTAALYRVRNNKTYVKRRDLNKTISVGSDNYAEVMGALSQSVETDLSHLKGKSVYLDKGIKLSFPTSGKNFVGNVPAGSSYSFGNIASVGIYWENIVQRRVDLDLSLVSLTGDKFGWDGRYRDAGILFSGDMTDATDGASEQFLFNNSAEDGLYLVSVNLYNRNQCHFPEGTQIPFTVFIADGADHFERPHMVDLSDIKFTYRTLVTPTHSQKQVGLVRIEGESRTFFAYDSITGANRTIRGNNVLTKQLIEYYNHYLDNIVPLEQALRMAGASIIDDKEKADYDLSIDTLTVQKITQLIEGEKT